MATKFSKMKMPLPATKKTETPIEATDVTPVADPWDIAPMTPEQSADLANKTMETAYAESPIADALYKQFFTVKPTDPEAVKAAETVNKKMQEARKRAK